MKTDEQRSRRASENRPEKGGDDTFPSSDARSKQCALSIVMSDSFGVVVAVVAVMAAAAALFSDL